MMPNRNRNPRNTAGRGCELQLCYNPPQLRGSEQKRVACDVGKLGRGSSFLPAPHAVAWARVRESFRIQGGRHSRGQPPGAVRIPPPGVLGTRVARPLSRVVQGSTRAKEEASRSLKASAWNWNTVVSAALAKATAGPAQGGRLCRPAWGRGGCGHLCKAMGQNYDRGYGRGRPAEEKWVLS